MDCGKHKNMIVMHAFSKGECELCGKEIQTSHIPCDKVCKECSEEHKVCQVCGDKIEEHGKGK